MANMQLDLAHMRASLGLARRGLGNTWPNPAVGCVLVREGRVVGRGWTQAGGRPHAEAEALIAAGVARVAAAVEDPDPRVSGSGLARLREAGLAVATGLCAAEAEELNAGFFSRVKRGRPLVTLKLATSLDGRLATASGASRWITGPAARERAHLLRATHDAVLVGTGTALADDPELTCRLLGLEDRSPVRIVIDRNLRLPVTLRMFAEARQVPTWLLTLPGSSAERQAVLKQQGVEIIPVEPDETGGEIDLAAMLRALGDKGLTRLLVEGGGALAASLLRAGLVDRLVWMRAPLVLGGDGIPAIAGLGLDRLAAAPRFELMSGETAGGDLIETYRRV